MEDNRRSNIQVQQGCCHRTIAFLTSRRLRPPLQLVLVVPLQQPLKVVIQSLSLSQIHRKTRDDGGAGPMFSASCHLNTLGLCPSFNEVSAWSAVLVLRLLPCRLCFCAMLCLPCSLWPGLVRLLNRLARDPPLTRYHHVPSRGGCCVSAFLLQQ